MYKHKSMYMKGSLWSYYCTSVAELIKTNTLNNYHVNILLLLSIPQLSIVWYGHLPTKIMSISWHNNKIEQFSASWNCKVLEIDKSLLQQ